MEPTWRSVFTEQGQQPLTAPMGSQLLPETGKPCAHTHTHKPSLVQVHAAVGIPGGRLIAAPSRCQEVLFELMNTALYSRKLP